MSVPRAPRSRKGPPGTRKPAEAIVTSLVPAAGGVPAHRPEDARPVFLVSGFRTSSTWLWKKLRAANTTLAFYEAFHECLASLDAKNAAATDTSIWESRHPSSAPYFLEFLPLLGEKPGVPGFESAMAFERFVPADGIDGNLSVREHRHVERLIACARAAHRIPVITCTRLLGRTRALAKGFDGRVVLLHRNLFHQWASFSSHAAAGNAYFLDAVRICLDHSRHEPFLRMLADWYSMPALSYTDERAFQLFLLFHLYLYAFAFDAADLVLDATAIASDETLRREAEKKLSAFIMAPVDLSDVECQFELSLFESGSPQASVETIDQFTKLIVGACPSAESAAFVETAKKAAIDEWMRHDFYARRLRRAHEVERRGRGEVEAARDMALAAQGALQTRLDEVAASHEAMNAALVQTAEERDAAKVRLGEVVASHEAMHAALVQAAAERDALKVSLAEHQASLAASQQAAAAAGSQRDALDSRVAALAASNEGLQASLSQAAGERDGFRTALDQQAAALAVARTEATDAAAERDALLEKVGALEAQTAAPELPLQAGWLRRALARRGS